MGGFFSFLFLSCLSFGQLWTLNGKPSASVLLFCTCYPWTWSRHIRQEHVRLFHHICSSWKFLLVIPKKCVRGRSVSGFLWCLETAIALLARPFLHSAQFSRFLPGQGLLPGVVSALRFGKSNWFVAISGGGFLELSVATSVVTVVTKDQVYRQVHKGFKGCPHNGQVWLKWRKNIGNHRQH